MTEPETVFYEALSKRLDGFFNVQDALAKHGAEPYAREDMKMMIMLRALESYRDAAHMQNWDGTGVGGA